MAFVWAIEKFSSLKLDQRVPFLMKSAFKEELMTLNLFLCEGQHSDEIIFIDFNNVSKKMKYFLFKAFMIDDKGNKIACNQREFWYEEHTKSRMFNLRLTKRELLEKKDLCLKDDVLSLYCECVFPTVISFEGIVSTQFDIIFPQSVPMQNVLEKQCDNFKTLEDFQNLFRDGTLSDIKLCTETESFPAHSTVLCARSPVFKAMFLDDMKEKLKGSVDIVDLDDDTARRMLLYMYTDSIEDLEWESALRLYEAADKYEILSLRKECSVFLVGLLSPTNACDALVLAGRHQDNDFKGVVQKYIVDCDKSVLCSEEWKNFLKDNSELAAEKMHKGRQK
ncbi:TD and POZ domain-containing protein 3 [Trichonephila clavipes]|nr:TD and POZ domain-containing protein 3 [Trichonephila clavipes]